MVPVRPRPARQCTATPPLFSNYFTTSVNFFTVLSEGQDPSGNSMSNTLIPYRSKIRASYNDSLRRTMHLIPICLKIGNNFWEVIGPNSRISKRCNIFNCCFTNRTDYLCKRKSLTVHKVASNQSKPTCLLFEIWTYLYNCVSTLSIQHLC